uniref:Uncharacterized protein n=1 Tax=Arundo donax TaxID=35708 RepID=A0A0A9GR89_ARUDO
MELGPKNQKPHSLKHQMRHDSLFEFHLDHTVHISQILWSKTYGG